MPLTEDVETLSRILGRYRGVHHYRDGLFSDILKATIPEASRRENEPATVALKVTTLSTNTQPHDAARESRLLRVAAGKHVIPLLETFPQPGGQLVMAFPFMPMDLNILLQQGKPPELAAKIILHGIFSGLAHLHALSIIHRDVKPSNILLASPQGPAYLADFGIAWSADDPSSERADEKILDVGTTCYRPPELLFGNQKYNTTLDLWAAGCVAAQVVCLGGKTLFDAGDLGSELALIKSIFENLGTPDTENWPVGYDEAHELISLLTYYRKLLNFQTGAR